MDILGVSNNAMQQFMAENKWQDDSLTAFQNVLDKAINDPDSIEKSKIMEACESFESYFLLMMFRAMRQTGFDDKGFIPKSHAEKVFTDMMDEQTANSAAKSGGVGLAQMMYKQMTREAYQKSMK